MSTNTPNLGLSQPAVGDKIEDTIPALATNFLTIDTAISNNTNNIGVLQTQISGVSSNQYVLPEATETVLGGVKIGAGIFRDTDGTISVAGGGSSGPATTTTLGTVIISDPNMAVDASGNLSLKSIIARLGTAQTWTSTQTYGSSNIATSSNNYGSNQIALQRSFWNGSSPVVGNSTISVDGTGGFNLTNESGTNILNISQSGNGAFSNSIKAPIILSSGISGATAASRYVGGTASGPPTIGSFVVGDFVIDHMGKIWICTVAGTPGTWVTPSAGANHFQERTSLLRATYSSTSTSNATPNLTTSGLLQFKYTATEWSTSSFYLEANIYGTSNYGVFLGLWDVTAGAAIAGSEISTTNSNTAPVTLRSAAATLTDGHVYIVYIRSGNSAGTAYCTAADLIALY